MLFGLPLDGAPVGPVVVPIDWEEQLVHCFEGVLQPANGDVDHFYWINFRLAFLLIILSYKKFIYTFYRMH